jgi:small subunit ribosomal protein S16
MAVKIRMTRMGRRHRPFFRINAINSEEPRDGKILEKLGHYDPLEKDPARQIVLNKERAQYWLDQGAIPSDTVSQILLKHGISCKYLEEKQVRRERARVIARKKGKFFTMAEKTTAEKAKAQAEAKAKEAEEKAKAKEAEEKAKAKEAEEKAKAKEAEEKTEAPVKEAEKTKVEETKKKAKAEKKAEVAEVEAKPEAKEKPKAEAESNDSSSEAQTSDEN